MLCSVKAKYVGGGARRAYAAGSARVARARCRLPALAAADYEMPLSRFSAFYFYYAVARNGGFCRHRHAVALFGVEFLFLAPDGLFFIIRG